MCGDGSSPNARNLSGLEIAKKACKVLFKFLKSSSLGPVTGIIFQKPDPENPILPITNPCLHKILLVMVERKNVHQVNGRWE